MQPHFIFAMQYPVIAINSIKVIALQQKIKYSGPSGRVQLRRSRGPREGNGTVPGQNESL